jgi:hypothetical protein
VAGRLLPALDGAVAAEVGEQARPVAPEPLDELALGQHDRLVVGPRRLQRVAHAQPRLQRVAAVLDLLERVADGVEAQAAVLELGDHLEALDVLGPVVGHAPPALGAGEGALRLVEADGAAGHAGGGGQLVDRVAGRFFRSPSRRPSPGHR